MSQLVGVIQHEFNMSVCRKALWVAYAMIMLFFIIAIGNSGLADMYPNGTSWQEAGQTVYLFNLFAPLIAGVLSADRMQRDHQLGVRELQISAPISHANYVIGKYIGVLLSVLLPLSVLVLGWSVFVVTMGFIELGMIGWSMAALILVAAPSFVFVIAFSLACPLIMPLRMYQVLFTGYWFWGNFLNADLFPSISGTLLNASGLYAHQAFFASGIGPNTPPLYTPLEAGLNIMVLGLCAAAVLCILIQYFVWQSKRA